jgi:peptidoglycan hydrolase-like protein with peptidoglycan-binding domain
MAAPRRHVAAPQQKPVDVYALQRKLKAKGYYKGPIDGIVGSGTRGALQRFMQNRR